MTTTTLWLSHQPKAFNAVKKGKLRYFYEFNIINKSHLKRYVFGKPLEEWIASSLEHGSISPLNEHLFLWSIEPDRLNFLIDSLMDQNIFLLDKNMKPNFD